MEKDLAVVSKLCTAVDGRRIVVGREGISCWKGGRESGREGRGVVSFVPLLKWTLELELVLENGRPDGRMLCCTVGWDVLVGWWWGRRKVKKSLVQAAKPRWMDGHLLK